MFERLKYKNHINEVIDFGANGIYVNMSDLHDYEWTVNKKGNRITSLTRKSGTRKLPVIIVCSSEAEGIAARNRMMEVFEKDCLAMEPGRVILGGYYFKCFVTKSVKKSYMTSNRMMNLVLTLQSDQPYWVKESTVSFGLGSAEVVSGGVDYPFDYPFDYTANAPEQIINPSIVPSNFRTVIYGACVNPSITIGGHKYQVNCTIESGGYLTIDSVAKTIALTDASGAVTNVFNSRNKQSYIFEKIPSGTSSVTWDGSFGFDIILLDERSEPKWT